MPPIENMKIGYRHVDDYHVYHQDSVFENNLIMIMIIMLIITIIIITIEIVC